MARGNELARKQRTISTATVVVEAVTRERTPIATITITTNVHPKKLAQSAPVRVGQELHGGSLSSAT